MGLTATMTASSLWYPVSTPRGMKHVPHSSHPPVPLTPRLLSFNSPHKPPQGPRMIESLRRQRRKRHWEGRGGRESGLYSMPFTPLSPTFISRANPAPSPVQLALRAAGCLQRRITPEPGRRMPWQHDHHAPASRKKNTFSPSSCSISASSLSRQQKEACVFTTGIGGTYFFVIYCSFPSLCPPRLLLVRMYFASISYPEHRL